MLPQHLLDSTTLRHGSAKRLRAQHGAATMYLSNLLRILNEWTQLLKPDQQTQREIKVCYVASIFVPSTHSFLDLCTAFTSSGGTEDMLLHSGGGNSTRKRRARKSLCSNVTDIAVRSLPDLQQVIRPPFKARISGCPDKRISTFLTLSCSPSTAEVKFNSNARISPSKA